MIWFILGGIVAVLITVNFFRDDLLDLTVKFLFSLVVWVLAFAVSGVVFLLSSVIVTESAEINWKKMSDERIVALNDNHNVSGDFYITSGHIDEKMCYQYIIQTEYGYYETNKVTADNAYIKYTEDDPHVEKYEGEWANNSTNLWGIPLCDYKYVIYCPKDAILNEFKIDLE